MSNEAKLAELRDKTDRELVILVERQLDRGLAVASLAERSGSPVPAEAEKALQLVNVLLRITPEVSWGEHVSLKTKLKELQSLVDHVPAVLAAPGNSFTCAAGSHAVG